MQKEIETFRYQGLQAQDALILQHIGLNYFSLIFISDDIQNGAKSLYEVKSGFLFAGIFSRNLV